MDISAIQNAICAHICERMPHDPPTFDALRTTIGALLPVEIDATLVLSVLLPAMVQSGQIRSFVNEERGTFYVRDC